MESGLLQIRLSVKLASPVQDAAFYQRLLDTLSEGVYFVNLDRHITYWNQAAERISGYIQEEVVGRGCFDNILVHTNADGRPLCTIACPLSATLRDGAVRAMDVFLKHKLGHRVPVSVRVSPMHDASGSIIGAVEVFSDNSSNIDAIQKAHALEQLALVDALTQVGNRRSTDLEIQRFHAAFLRQSEPYGILFLDLDHFKEINDRHGHEAGDATLRMTAKTIANSIRSFDFLGRWGGEEFLAILANIDPAEAAATAERCRALVQSCRLDWRHGVIRPAVSIGVAVVRAGESPAALIGRADENLYAAKKAGRNRVVGP